MIATRPVEASVMEAEILLPVTCPICSQQTLLGFRMAVVIEAVLSRQIRLYSSCHLAAWDASKLELDALFEYLDTAGAETGEVISIGDSSEHPQPVFVE